MRYVVSAGRRIDLNHTIERGTHPEQNIICSSEEFSRVSLYGDEEMIVAEGLSPDIEGENLLLRSLFEYLP